MIVGKSHYRYSLAQGRPLLIGWWTSGSFGEAFLPATLLDYRWEWKGPEVEVARQAQHRLVLAGKAVIVPCNCRRCLRERDERTAEGWPVETSRMILCVICGNKRCPHASDHRYACTDSNEPGQPGSVYGAV
jgi:hypothetical protein